MKIFSRRYHPRRSQPLPGSEFSCVLSQITGAKPTAINDRYNAAEHPVAFHKAQDFGKAPKKIAGEAAPDLEDVFDVSLIVFRSFFKVLHAAQLDEEVEEEPEPKADAGDDDVAHDSLIKAGGKGKGKGKGKVAAPAKASGKAAGKK